MWNILSEEHKKQIQDVGTAAEAMLNGEPNADAHFDKIMSGNIG